MRKIFDKLSKNRKTDINIKNNNANQNNVFSPEYKEKQIFGFVLDGNIIKGKLKIYEIQPLTTSLATESAYNFLLGKTFPPTQRVYINSQGTVIKNAPLLYFKFNKIYIEDMDSGYNLFDSSKFLEELKKKNNIDENQNWLLFIDSNANMETSTLHRRLAKSEPNLYWLNSSNNKSFLNLLLRNKAIQRLAIQELAPSLNPSKFEIVLTDSFQKNPKREIEKIAASMDITKSTEVMIKIPNSTRGQGTKNCKLAELYENFEEISKNKPTIASNKSYFVIESVHSVQDKEKTFSSYRFAAISEPEKTLNKQCIVFKMEHKNLLSSDGFIKTIMPENPYINDQLSKFLLDILNLDPLIFIEKLLLKKSEAIKIVCQDIIDELKRSVLDEIFCRIYEMKFKDIEIQDLLPYADNLLNSEKNVSCNKSTNITMPNLKKLKSSINIINQLEITKDALLTFHSSKNELLEIIENKKIINLSELNLKTIELAIKEDLHYESLKFICNQLREKFFLLDYGYSQLYIVGNLCKLIQENKEIILEYQNQVKNLNEFKNDAYLAAHEKSIDNTKHEDNNFLRVKILKSKAKDDLYAFFGNSKSDKKDTIDRLGLEAPHSSNILLNPNS